MLLSVQKIKEMYVASAKDYFLNGEKEGLIIPLRLPKGRRRYKKKKT